jgi:hypothetical protein
MRWSERLAALSAVLAWVLVAPALALAASPTPEAVGDPRSSGQGPGLVGDPLMAIGVVTAIALLARIGTQAYVRLTAGREPRRGG